MKDEISTWIMNIRVDITYANDRNFDIKSKMNFVKNFWIYFSMKLNIFDDKFLFENEIRRYYRKWNFIDNFCIYFTMKLNTCDNDFFEKWITTTSLTLKFWRQFRSLIHHEIKYFRQQFFEKLKYNDIIENEILSTIFEFTLTFSHVFNVWNTFEQYMTLNWNILFVIMSRALSKIVTMTIAITSKFIVNIKFLIELFVYVLICSTLFDYLFDFC